MMRGKEPASCGFRLLPTTLDPALVEKHNLKQLVFFVLQFLREENFHQTARMLEKESGLFFNMKHLEDLLLGGKWEEAEQYLCGFTTIEDNNNSRNIFFEIRKQKYFEAIDSGDRAKAVNILEKELRAFKAHRKNIYEQFAMLLSLDNLRDHELCSEYGDTETARADLSKEVGFLVSHNPVFRDKTNFPYLDGAILRRLIFKGDSISRGRPSAHKPPRPNSSPAPSPVEARAGEPVQFPADDGNNLRQWPLPLPSPGPAIGAPLQFPAHGTNAPPLVPLLAAPVTAFPAHPPAHPQWLDPQHLAAAWNAASVLSPLHQYFAGWQLKAAPKTLPSSQPTVPHQPTSHTTGSRTSPSSVSNINTDLSPAEASLSAAVPPKTSLAAKANPHLMSSQTASGANNMVLVPFNLPAAPKPTSSVATQTANPCSISSHRVSDVPVATPLEAEGPCSTSNQAVLPQTSDKLGTSYHAQVSGPLILHPAVSETSASTLSQTGDHSKHHRTPEGSGSPKRKSTNSENVPKRAKHGEKSDEPLNASVQGDANALAKV